jgi:hypothetical protein
MDPRIGGMGFLAKDIRDKKHEIFVVRVKTFVEEDGSLMERFKFKTLLEIEQDNDWQPHVRTR